jgi:hypothetical protein
MAYIGQGIKEGTFSVLDTSGNTYNGSNVTFSLGTQVGSPAQLLVSHDGVIQKPGTDYTLATGGTQITFTTAPASGASIFIVEISGAVGGPLDSDLNGTELILDADADTSITADTDDQIDIKVGGSDRFKFDNSGHLSLLTDSGAIKFGADSDVTLTHDPDDGLFFKSAATADDNPVLLTLQTGETDLAADDVIGKISFQAPDEGTGTDAILVSAAIQAVAEGDHSSSSNATSLQFMTGASEAAAEKVRIDSAGRVGIGNTAMGSYDANGKNLVVGSHSGSNGITVACGSSGSSNIMFATGTSGDQPIKGRIRYNESDNHMGFYTDGDSERLRITSAGCVGIGTSGDNTRLKVEGSTDGEKMMQLRHGDADNPVGMEIQYFGGAPDGSGDPFHGAQDSSATRFKVLSDGDVQNHDNAYGSISDERIKQDITDSGSQWDDIKAIKVRKYKKKDDVRQYGNDAWVQLGVIAQELEASNMDKLIRNHDPDVSDILSDSSFGTLVDDTNNPLTFYEDGDVIPEGKKIGDGKTFPKKVGEVKAKVKSVQYSILYMKAIKALQEAIAKIESLEARVTTLEG